MAVLLMTGVWIARILLPTCILIIMYIFKQELAKRKQDIRIDSDPYPKWLNFWSSLTFISCIIFLLIWTLHRVPIICLYSYGFMISTWGTPGACITMYQITRLQYCFSAKQIHSDKYGYPKWLFCVLYAQFFLLGIYYYTISWFVYNSWPSQYYNGCEGGTNQYGYLAYFAFLWFWIWDLLTLILYVIKIKQIKRSQAIRNQNDDTVYKKVKFILYKIVLLTIIYEIKTLFGAGLTVIFGGMQIISILSPIIVAMDALMAVFVMYLMIEHNNDEYIRFLTLFRGCCCCCFRWIFNDLGLDENNRNFECAVVDQTQTEDVEIQIKMNEYRHESVQTTTMIDY